MQKINVTIRGISPLLMHRFPENEGKIEEKSKKRAGNPEYEKEVEQGIYKFPDGKPYQPASHIEGTMIKASTNFQISGKKKKTYKDLVKGSVFVFPDAIPHKIQKWIVDRRSVVVPATRGRVIRARPRLDNWELDFTIEIRNDQLPIEVVKQILDTAGNEVGIGDFRPRFGRFIVTRFEEA
jgi:hypothetical protein